MHKQTKIWLAGLGLTLAASAAQAAPQYSVTDVATLTSQEVYWTGLANHGALVGSIGSGAATLINGQLTAYSNGWDGVTSIAVMNDRGGVAFDKDYYGWPTGAGYVGANGQATEMPALYGVTYRGFTIPAAINNAGVVVGVGAHTNGVCPGGDPGCEFYQRWKRAFVYENGQTRDLGTLGGNESAASAINDWGTVVGWSDTGAGQQAFVYANGAMQSLEVGGTWSAATGINEAGQIIGNRGAGGVGSAWLYDNGNIVSLADNARALFLNNAGQVVGISGDREWLYADGEISFIDQLLDESGWQIHTVLGLNDQGQILVAAQQNGGVLRTLLLNPDEPPVLLPVPEPGTYGMLVAGLGIVALWRRKRGA